MQVPCAVVEVTQAEPVPGFFVVMCTVILWMKLVSYAHCNHDFRCAPPTPPRQAPLNCLAALPSDADTF